MNAPSSAKNVCFISVSFIFIPWILSFWIITLDTSVRNFQYKLLTRIILTNKLIICKIVDSNLCDFCNNTIETIEHLFYDCHYSQILWNNISKYLNDKNIKVTFHRKKALLGITKMTQYSKQLNFIIITAKYFIFKMKYKKMIPMFNIFKHYLNMKLNIEKEIAIKNDMLDLYQSTWGAFEGHAWNDTQRSVLKIQLSNT